MIDLGFASIQIGSYIDPVTSGVGDYAIAIGHYMGASHTGSIVMGYNTSNYYENSIPDSLFVAEGASAYIQSDEFLVLCHCVPGIS